VVDRSVRPVDGDIVVATVHGERSLKRLRMTGGRPRLMFENSEMPLFDLTEVAEVEIWGLRSATSIGCERGSRDDFIRTD
jgi:DNA polymerase V